MGGRNKKWYTKNTILNKKKENIQEAAYEKKKILLSRSGVY